jgi:hypothetical protein
MRLPSVLLIALVGCGSAPEEADLGVTIRGETSTTRFEFEGVEDGDGWRFVGTAVLDGAAHGIPNGFGSGCVQTAMPLDLTLVVRP